MLIMSAESKRRFAVEERQNLVCIEQKRKTSKNAASRSFANEVSAPTQAGERASERNQLSNLRVRVDTRCNGGGDNHRCRTTLIDSIVVDMAGEAKTSNSQLVSLYFCLYAPLFLLVELADATRRRARFSFAVIRSTFTASARF